MALAKSLNFSGPLVICKVNRSQWDVGRVPSNCNKSVFYVGLRGWENLIMDFVHLEIRQELWKPLMDTGKQPAFKCRVNVGWMENTNTHFLHVGTPGSRDS